MSEVAERIRAALEHEQAINTHRDRIDVVEDDNLRLVGEVHDIGVKRKALQLARKHGETQRIQDDLRLERGERLPDDQIADQVVRALMADPLFLEIPVSRHTDVPLSPAGHGVHVSVEDALVRLEGSMPSLNHRRLAEVLVWWIPGVTDVDNRVRVEPAEQDNDGEISEALRLVIEKDQALNPDEINAVVKNAEATLAGRVSTRDQAHRAEQDCWYVPGVHAVHNELRVIPD